MISFYRKLDENNNINKLAFYIYLLLLLKYFLFMDMFIIIYFFYCLLSVYLKIKINNLNNKQS